MIYVKQKYTFLKEVELDRCVDLLAAGEVFFDAFKRGSWVFIVEGILGRGCWFVDELIRLTIGSGN
jgi:hypothetical protein